VLGHGVADDRAAGAEDPMFASIVAEVGVPPRRAMYLLGHTDPTLAMRVCQVVVLDMGGAAIGQLEGVVGCTIQEAFVTYSGREGLGTQWAPGPEITSNGAMGKQAFARKWAGLLVVGHSGRRTDVRA
jgi:hypothetical protein